LANIRLESLRDSGSFINAKGIFGAGAVMDWKSQAALEGKVFNVTVGTLSTGIVGGGNGTVLDIDQPEFVISIPSGVTVVPISFNIQGNCADAVADHSVLEAVVCLSRYYTWAADGASTAETPICTKLVGGGASRCACASAHTGDMTLSSAADPVHDVDLARMEVKIDLPANGETPVILELRYNPDPPPFLVGPCTITGYWGGTSAVTGYAQLYWAEYSTSDLF
jgi:hypothetical protein